MKWKKFIILGDSNTQFGFGISNWVSSIADLLQRKCDVINRGFSGYNTDKIRIILPQILEEFNPQSTCGMILMLGSNDSTKEVNKIQHVPLNRFSDNMSHIVDYLINWGLSKDKLILVSPPRIFDKKWQEAKPNEITTHFDYLVKDYAEASIKVAKDKKIIYLNFNKIMHEYGNDYGELLFDGLHLSQKGGDLLFKNLSPIINENIACDLNFNFPYWKDIKEDATEINQ